MECQLNGFSMYYESYGEGRPILMLHGMSLDHRHMVADIEPFFEHRENWKRIYPDLPGMGRTPGKQWITSQDQMLEVTLDFIDKVMPGERFVVVGASYGGYLARGVVLHRGNMMDGMCLYTPTGEGAISKRDLPPAMTLVHDPELLAELAPQEAAILSQMVVQNRKVLDSIREIIIPAQQLADHEFIKQIHGSFAFSYDMDALSEPFSKPVLILTGRQDHWVGYRDMWKLLDNYPRATYAVLDRAGHALSVEQEGLFRALINEWLDRVKEDAAQAHQP